MRWNSLIEGKLKEQAERSKKKNRLSFKMKKKEYTMVNKEVVTERHELIEK